MSWISSRRRRALVALGIACLVTAGASRAAAMPTTPSAMPQRMTDEVFYQIFTRSMRDSNGDRQGDLAGLQQSLPYLQRLGVTSILLTPLYPSDFYHNYFARDFYGIDPGFGDMAAFRRLIAAIHARHMKIYLDEEIQYVTYNHPWFRSALDHPASPYSGFLIWHGPHDTKPEEGPFGITWTDRFPGGRSGITTVNLTSPAVEAYFTRYFLDWADPGNSGVDGFRLDHMMDDLDGKHLLTNLFDKFWKPLFARVRAADPRVRFIAEQADWGDGAAYLTPGNVDAVFAFPLAAAIRSFDRDRIAAAIEKTAAITPAGKYQLVFAENHDMSRIASADGITPEKLRTAAALSILLRGVPLIYYGQELGMRGKPWPRRTDDSKDIGDREAFRWSADGRSSAEADWYRGTGVYWTQRYNRGGDGVSVAEEQRNPDSLLARYRHLLRLRRAIPALRDGDERVVAAAGNLLVLERDLDGAAFAIVSNLGPQAASYRPTGDGRDLIGGDRATAGGFTLAAYQTALFRTR